jgi:glycosyltransferase involved in cell wall biosynthesis
MARPAARPAVSVVMPVRDAADTLAAAVDSVLAQSETDWELVAVDDGSTDASPRILRDYAAAHPRVRVVAAERGGLVPALNAGLAAARGGVVARMDADDLCLPDRLARQRHHLEVRPDLGLVACRVRFGGDRAAAAGYARHVDWTNDLLSHEAIALARFVESPLAHPSVMFRRELPERFGAYREGDFPEDYELWLRWLERGVRMEKLAEPLLVWRDSPARLSRRDPRYAPEAFHRVKARYLARWLARHNPHHPRVVFWGAGRVTRRRAQFVLDAGVEIAAYVDVDPRKIGRAVGGRPVIGPAALPSPGACFVVAGVASVNAREQIERALIAAGHRAGRDYVLAG